MAKTSSSLNEPVLAGPFSLFDDSFILEFLKPDPSRNASSLMRATYKAANSLTRQGKSHPQSPPLHLHFDQSETFQVLSGRVGTTETYDVVDRIWTPADTVTPHVIPPWKPHRFWPVPDTAEDTVLLVWAHPRDVPEPMDDVFFQNVLTYISDVHEKKASLSLLQVMLMQHVSATALIMFPTAKWLGPIRWWLPWQLQGMCAAIARILGYTPILQKYTSPENWERFLHAKAT